MSIFLCARCRDYRDSDDGCEPTADGNSLICIDCVNEQADDEWEDWEPQGDCA